ncbi:MAG: hypothetical protein ACM3S1_02000 [Hyphomicrobiales bacterium]
MTQTALEVSDAMAGVVETVVISGDLSKLQPAQRVTYYRSVCESLGSTRSPGPWSTSF